ncbi:hypothetical protein BZA77DRAFT_363404, partial [Pyronema omphalodes]
FTAHEFFRTGDFQIDSVHTKEILFSQSISRTKPMDPLLFVLLSFHFLFSIYSLIVRSATMVFYVVIFLAFFLFVHIGIWIPSLTLTTCSWMIANYLAAGISVPLGLIIAGIASAICCVVHLVVLFFFYFKGLRYTIEALEPYIELLAWVVLLLNSTAYWLLSDNLGPDTHLKPIWSTMMGMKLFCVNQSHDVGKIVACCLLLLMVALQIHISFSYLGHGLHLGRIVSDKMDMFHDTPHDILGRNNTEGCREDDQPTPLRADHDDIESNVLAEAFPEE